MPSSPARSWQHGSPRRLRRDAVHGRLFVADDAQRSAIVGLAVARRQFGGGEQAIGQSLRLEGRTYTIVGVLPPSFQFPERIEAWIAASRNPEILERTAYNYRVVAKLREGVGVDTLNARLAALGARLAAEYPGSNADKSCARAREDEPTRPILRSSGSEPCVRPCR